MRFSLRLSIICFFLLSSLCLCGSSEAGDWPQILGPERNGIARDETLASSWPKEGPKTLWERKVGSGFAGVAVKAGKLILFHRQGEEEIVEALNAKTGKPIWKVTYSAHYVPSFTSDGGPRCVPIIHQGHVYVYGARGDLRCIELASGEKKWERDTFNDYNSKRRYKGDPPEGYFGIGSTPIVEGDKLLVNVGGDTKGAGIVAFSLKTGKTLWTATKERASYSSPVAVTLDGTRHVIFATRLNIVSIDPVDGSTRFRIPFGRTGPNVTAATPLVVDGHLFVSASYRFGAVYANISKSRAKILWASDELLSSQYTTAIADGGVLYGIHGRQDAGFAELRCIDPKTQKVRWEEIDFGYATLLMADRKLLMVTSDGELVLAELNPDRYKQLARTRLFSGSPPQRTSRALPALSNGLLYVRDTRTLKCVVVGKQK